MTKHPYRNTNIVLSILFILFAAIIWFRKTDGSGLAQTTSLRWAALASFYAFVLIIERIIFPIARRSRK
ncbi:DUF3923 family protein [Lactobacillus sp. M0390]|uniref:DUF3923 family protein n=1 Tax=Lactobacillus TaxID=1578 RepID=UPI00351CAEF6|nr:DUF3923 family protein [Lactobacillus apis]